MTTRPSRMGGLRQWESIAREFLPCWLKSDAVFLTLPAGYRRKGDVCPGIAAELHGIHCSGAPALRMPSTNLAIGPAV